MQSYSLHINNHYSIIFIHKFKAALRQCKLVNANLFELQSSASSFSIGCHVSSFSSEQQNVGL